MAARAIGDEDADYSFLIKQCSSRINCCSACVCFAAIRTNARPAKRASSACPAGGVQASSGVELWAAGIIDRVCLRGLADGAPPGHAVAPTTHRQRWPDPYRRSSRAPLRQCQPMPEPSPDRLGRPARSGRAKAVPPPSRAGDLQEIRLSTQVRGRDLDEHPGVLGHQQTTTAG